MSKISIVDQPVSSVLDENGTNIIRRKQLAEAGDKRNPDSLKTGKYAETLAEFIKRCDTPLTIGVQGEWGSGKTSLLNMIKEDIEEEDASSYVLYARKGSVHGSEAFKTIWINTWEHSLLKSPEECLISIIEEIIEEVGKVDGNLQATQKAKSALSSLAKGALRVGVTAALGSKAGQVADDMLGEQATNSVKTLRKTLEEIVADVRRREQNKAQRFVIFVDDLDRLEPSIAVMVLELLKNIFNIPYCVFVLAIDYQVVVKGLKGKFGEPNEQNEWEFRAFFDKIIQVPFMMPMNKYDVKEYVNTILIDEIQYFTKSESKLIMDGRLARIVKLSVGQNPRSLKRLLNSLSLIRLHYKDRLEDGDQITLKQLVFALVCFQISYPKIYELMLRNPDFTTWDDSFVAKAVGGPVGEDEELNTALNKALSINEEDFDEEWEQALFKIVWVNKWQRNKLIEASRLLTEIKDVILYDYSGAAISKLMHESLELSAVTSIASTTEGTIFDSDNEDAEAQESLRNRISYWRKFSSALENSNTVFDRKINAIRNTYSSWGMGRRKKEISSKSLQIVHNLSSNAPITIEISGSESDMDFNYAFFSLLKNYETTLINATGGSAKFDIREGATKQKVILTCPDIPKKLYLHQIENAEHAETVINWIASCLPKIEAVLVQVDTKIAAKNN
jgi:hypothetical protein